MSIMKGLMRTFRIALEEKLKEEVAEEHPLTPWLVEHASQTRNRFQMGWDGKTPIKRLRGRSVASPVCEFGEKVWWLPLKDKPNARPTFKEGIYVGSTSLDYQPIVCTPEGAFTCRTVRPMAEADRWDASILDYDYSVLQPNPLQPGQVRVGVRVPNANYHVPPAPASTPRTG